MSENKRQFETVLQLTNHKALQLGIWWSRSCGIFNENLLQIHCWVCL